MNITRSGSRGNPEIFEIHASAYASVSPGVRAGAVAGVYAGNNAGANASLQALRKAYKPSLARQRYLCTFGRKGALQGFPQSYSPAFQGEAQA